MEGLWIAKFTGNALSGAGVVVFQGDQVLGGDSGYYYAGKLQLAVNNQFSANVTVAPHSLGNQSVFGTTGQTLHLMLSGTLSDDGSTLTTTGYPVELPSARFQASLTKRSI